jgi:hypothetical protein
MTVNESFQVSKIQMTTPTLTFHIEHPTIVSSKGSEQQQQQHTTTTSNGDNITTESSSLSAPSSVSNNVTLAANKTAKEDDHEVLLESTEVSTTTPTEPAKKKYFGTAIIIEMQCHLGLSLVLKQAAQFLNVEEWRIVIYHSKENYHFVQGLIDTDPILQKQQESGRISLYKIKQSDYGSTGLAKRGKKKGIYFEDYWYSKMLINETFYTSTAIDTEYVMTLQSDTLLCRPFSTQDFVSPNSKTSFIGGISGFKRKYPQQIRVTGTPRNDTVDRYNHLNGGFSLRNVAWTVECIRQYAVDRSWIEDALYRHCREQEINGTVHVTEEQAYGFASDNGRTLCFNKPNTGDRVCPVGVHKPWSQGVDKWGREMYKELTDSCPGLLLHQELCQQGAGGVLKQNSTCPAYDVSGTSKEFHCQCTSGR